MKLTIFGSERQDSLYELYDVTNIKENLTYTHSTKETLQAIEFCKNNTSMPCELTRFMFRTGLLNKCILNPSNFTQAFAQTDLFVIEISSIIAYSYDGYYAHHIATDEAYGFSDRKNIHQRALTDEEIERDLLRVRALFGVKPFIVVSTSETRELLRTLCTVHVIPLFDPQEQFGEINTQPGPLYKSFIDSVLKLPLPSINSLTVYESVFPKYRCGSPADGGYVIADLSGYDALFGCGINDDIRFELAFLKKHPIKCYAYDGTINALPDKSEPLIQFHKMNIGPENTAMTTNLHREIEPYSNIFLKMDIESYEFRWLRTLSIQQLRRFKQIVIEFHIPFTPYPNYRHLDIQIPVHHKMNVLTTLSHTHTLVHLHGNNCCGTVEYQGVAAPNVFECTYVRKDVQDLGKLNSVPIPSDLDHPNLRAPDIILGGLPFVFAAHRPTFIFVLQQKYHNQVQTKKDNFWGLGDMLRGICTSYMICKKLGYDFYLDIRGHPIGEWLQDKGHPFTALVDSKRATVPFTELNSPTNLERFLTSSATLLNPILFSTNGPIVKAYDEDSVTFIKGVLSPSTKFAEFYERNKPASSYSILHFRLGDEYLMDGNTSGLDTMYNIFVRNVTATDILISDSPAFKKYVHAKHPCPIYDFPICHIGIDTNSEAIRNTLFEFFLAAKATAIKTHSNYSWVSGFMDSVHKIFKTPLAIV